MNILSWEVTRVVNSVDPDQIAPKSQFDLYQQESSNGNRI